MGFSMASQQVTKVVSYTLHGLTLYKRTLPTRETWWQTEDGQWEVGEVRHITFCDGPHPERYKGDGGAIVTGYCDGEQEHDMVAGWGITRLTGRSTPSEIDDVYPTRGRAWEVLADWLERVGA